MSLTVVKSKIVESGLTMSKVVEELNKIDNFGSLQNLSQKITRGTLKYTEAEQIADVIGYEIIWRKKEPSTN